VKYNAGNSTGMLQIKAHLDSILYGTALKHIAHLRQIQSVLARTVVNKHSHPPFSSSDSSSGFTGFCLSGAYSSNLPP